jgi:hypothetical protein
MMKVMSKPIEILANEAGKLVDEINELDAKIKQRQARLHIIKTKDLAELMDNEGIEIGSKFVMSNGKTIHVKEFFTCSIPSLSAILKEKDSLKQISLQDKRKKAFAWLDSKGKGDIIKNTITALFNREEAEKAKALMNVLAEKGITCQRDENVHSATLTATLREAMGNGEEVPTDVFAIYRGTIVDVK